VAADKAMEQELKARTREVITTKQEQMHITHEQVKMVFDMKFIDAITWVNIDDNLYCERCYFSVHMAVITPIKSSCHV
jgi:hypothetical protein